MDCTRFEQLIQRYLDADLGPVHTRLLEEHTASCGSCSMLQQQFEVVFESLRSYPRDEAPADLELAILSAIDFEAYRPSLRERVLRWLVRPEEVLPSPAQMGLAVVFLVTLLHYSTGRMGEGLRRYFDALGGAATWTYVWANGLAAEVSTRFLVDRWPVIRQTVETLTHACRLLLERSAVLWIGGGVILGVVLIAGAVRHARAHRGGPRARFQLG